MPLNKATLFYIHDPMCSWCWGFNNTWQEVKKTLQNQVDIQYIVGGLAPDSDEPMPRDMQAAISSYWRTIQQRIPGTEFNFDFWEKCSPRRSTYPSCRAVLAAKTIDPNKEAEMILCIQQAYYLNAKNPSNIDTLVEIAASINIDPQLFRTVINNSQTEQLFQQNLQFSRQIGAHGFPSLFLSTVHNNQENTINIPIDYNSPNPIISAITSKL